MNCVFTIGNALSLLRVLLTPFIVYFFFQGYGWGIALILFTVAGLTDFGDGYFARKFGKVSLMGTFLDPIADKILVISLLSCFAVIEIIPWWFVFLVLIRDISVTLWRCINIKKCALITPSYWGKLKMFAQILFIYLLFFTAFIAVHFRWHFFMLLPVKIVLYGIAGLTAYSGFDYFYRYLKFKQK